VSKPSAQLKPVRLMLTGGGTGGHLFPAVATAENLSSRAAGSEILFVGTKRKLDRNYLEQFGFSVKTIHSYGLKGKKITALIKGLAVLPVSFCQACYHILRFRPHVVCGVGGYVTGPVIAAAWLLRKPTIIHEQNSVPGLANRKLGPLVSRICISLPQSGKYFPAGKTVLTGNPVRSRIVEVADSKKSHDDKMTILVLGGSQGAHGINQLMVEALSMGNEGLPELRVIHQTGKNDEEMVSRAYQKTGLDAQVAAFFTDMAAIYKQADLVVSRAGATTLAEIAVLGKPAILIPYPFAADNHQQTNGLWYVESGAAVLLEEQGLTAEKLGATLKEILLSPEKREKMSAAMRKLSMPDAAEKIVDICQTLA